MEERSLSFSYLKLIFVVVLFVLSMVSFVVQTEITSVLFTQYHLKDPVLLMALTHGSWWILWPLQFVLVAGFKTFKRYRQNKNGYVTPGRPWRGFRRSFTSSVKTQHRNVAYSAELATETNHEEYIKEFPNRGAFKRYIDFYQSFALKHIYASTLLLCIILNLAGSTWYFSMRLSTGADVTAIYNCSAFTAYLFAIPILHDKFSITKMVAVVTAVAGVFVVAYGGSKSTDSSKYPHRVFGNIVILFGAILYGLYEVLYKKLCCPPQDEVSARRQATFSNFTMCLIGVNSAIVLSLLGGFSKLVGLYNFTMPHGSEVWALIWLSIAANLIFSVTFLGLMSLTSPVFSSVASLLTILLVGVYEWAFRGIAIGTSQLIGYTLIMVGFGLLTKASWKEISEEDQDDELIDTDTESTMTQDSFAT